jgi:tRNA A37 threonylcarbamoyladenosine synthetase subunit TsaC/SUA5/YrdC
LKIIKKCKKIYQSSANISGCQVIDNIDEAIKIFAKSLNKIIFIQTPTYKSKPATIVDLDKKKIIRDERNIGNKILNELKYITLKKCKK